MDTDDTGVFSCEPRCAGGATYRESIVMGYTNKSGWQLENLIAEMQLEYRGHDYHMHLHNCITFSDDLCYRLTQKHVPAWLNRLPHIAHALRCCLPRYLRGPYPVFDDDSSGSCDSPLMANEKTPFMPPRGNTSSSRITIPRGDPRSHSDAVPPAAAKRLGIAGSPEAAVAASATETASTTATTPKHEGKEPTDTAPASSCIDGAAIL